MGFGNLFELQNARENRNFRIVSLRLFVLELRCQELTAYIIFQFSATQMEFIRKRENSTIQRTLASVR